MTYLTEVEREVYRGATCLVVVLVIAVCAGLLVYAAVRA